MSETSTSFAFGLAFLTSSITFAFSASVNLNGFPTGVLVGSLISSAAFDVSSTFLTVLSGVNVATDPSLNVTVAVPSFPTSTLSAFGFAFLTSSITFAFSSSVKLFGLTTLVTSGTLTPSASFVAFSTVLSGVNVASDPSLNVTVAVPSFPTTTFATFPGFAASIAFLTLSFSSSVKFVKFCTGVLAGSWISLASLPFTSNVIVTSCGV